MVVFLIINVWILKEIHVDGKLSNPLLRRFVWLWFNPFLSGHGSENYLSFSCPHSSWQQMWGGCVWSGTDCCLTRKLTNACRSWIRCNNVCWSVVGCICTNPWFPLLFGLPYSEDTSRSVKWTLCFSEDCDLELDDVLCYCFAPNTNGRVWVLVIALRPQTPKHIRGGWSHYTDTREPVDGNGAQNTVTIQSGFRTKDISITGPTRLPPALTGPAQTVDSSMKERKVLWRGTRLMAGCWISVTIEDREGNITRILEYSDVL
jgi:hypothetical protein